MEENQNIVQPHIDDSAMRYFSQTPQPQISDEIRRWQLDPEELLFRVEKFLRRQTYDFKLKKYVTIAGVPPFANELGIQTILSHLSSILDPRSTTLSNFDEDHVLRMAAQSRHALRDNIVASYQAYEISAKDIDLVIKTIDLMVFGAYRRAYMGGERRSQAHSYQTLEQVRRGDYQDGGSKKISGFFK